MKRISFNPTSRLWRLLIFLLAFIPRALYPVSRTALWYQRSIRFIEAVLAQDWNGTYQQYHPGVMTMWLAGPAIKLFAASQNVTAAQLLGEAAAAPGTIPRAFQAGIIPIALVIALGIVLIYRLAARLFTPEFGLAAALLLAIDPVFLTYSKVLHVDALLSTFMLVSALYMLLYYKNSQPRHLLLSGLFAGFALLSKSSAFFLVPYAALVLFWQGLMVQEAPKRFVSRINLSFVGKILRDLAIWLGVAVVVFFLLFPAMWVQPLETLQIMVQRVDFHVSTPHFNATYFNGRLLTEDPGLAYHMAVLLWRTTALSWLMLLAAVGIMIYQAFQKKLDVILAFLFIYLAAFILQMTLAAREEIRYILPAFLMVDVLAAYGLTKIISWLGQTPFVKKRPYNLAAIAALMLLAVQALIVFTHHPYYGTHFNYLFGGAKVGQRCLVLQDQGEGLDLAAQYLNSLPNAENASVAMHPLAEEFFGRSFVGNVNDGSPIADYRVFYLNQRMRLVGGEIWDFMWSMEQDSDPLWTVEFDGITYVWVYGGPPEQ